MRSLAPAPTRGIRRVVAAAKQLFYSHVERGDAQRQRIELYGRERRRQHRLGQGCAARKLTDAFGKVAVGLRLVTRQHLPDARQNMAKIPAVDCLEGLPGRLGEFEDRDFPPRLADAGHLGQSAVGVGYVPQPKSDRDNLKAVVLEGEILGVGFLKVEYFPYPPPLLFLLTDGKHLGAEIGSKNRR